MRWLMLLGLLVAAGLAIHARLAGEAPLPPAAAPTSPLPTAPTAEEVRPPLAAAPLPPAEVPTIRNVTPATGFTPPPSYDAPPERIVEPAPPPPSPEPDTDLLLRVVVIESATTLRSGDILVQIEGLAGPDGDARCRSVEGEERPCAVLATAALRALVGRRGVSCRLPKGTREGTFRTACRLGPLDLAEWLARHGWAIAVAGASAAVTVAAAEARERHAGLWSADEIP